LVENALTENIRADMCEQMRAQRSTSGTLASFAVST
jgi:hypothetical protein